MEIHSKWVLGHPWVDLKLPGPGPREVGFLTVDVLQEVICGSLAGWGNKLLSLRESADPNF